MEDSVRMRFFDQPPTISSPSMTFVDIDANRISSKSIIIVMDHQPLIVVGFCPCFFFVCGRFHQTNCRTKNKC